VRLKIIASVEDSRDISNGGPHDGFSGCNCNILIAPWPAPITDQSVGMRHSPVFGDQLEIIRIEARRTEWRAGLPRRRISFSLGPGRAGGNNRRRSVAVFGDTCNWSLLRR
jgi:hypothetical protein